MIRAIYHLCSPLAVFDMAITRTQNLHVICLRISLFLMINLL